MYTLFKLDSKEEGFANISEAKDFFSNELPERDKNYFYNENRILHIKHDETICFSLSDYIVAKATFVGEIIENNNREGKNKFGHKLVNIEI
ncbi:MAG: hypothetical protein MUP09_01410, partial [Thiovulaceae bacterium]|nr:hypothetical protein [Sulfurimonadaceae bacterium]